MSVHADEMSDTSVEKEELQLILEASRHGSSHGNIQPWRYSVFTDSSRVVLSNGFAGVARVAEPSREEFWRQRVWKAPVWVAVGVEYSNKFPRWEEIAAMATSVHNMQIVGCELGVGSCWCTSPIVTHDLLYEVIGWDENRIELCGFLYFGYPQDPQIWKRERKRKAVEEFITFP